MTRRLPVIAAILVLAIAWFLWTRGPEVSPSLPAPGPTSTAAPQEHPQLPKPGPPPLPLEPSRSRTAKIGAGEVRLAPGAEELVRKLNEPTQTPAHDLEVVYEVLASYRRIFGENPFGGLNDEITASLTGKNPKHLAVIPPDSAEIDAQGQLVDRWGTPYFFHPVSRQIMEVLSAGPDGELWTDDDVTAE